MFYGFQYEESSPTSSLSSVNHIFPNTTLNIGVPWRETQHEIYEKLYPEDYNQNFDIVRMTIATGCSQTRHMKGKKIECNTNDESKKDESESTNHKNRNIPNYRPERTTTEPSEGRNNYERNSPRVTTQFDSKKLFEEIEKSDGKKCSFCGKINKKSRQQDLSEKRSKKETLQLNTPTQTQDRKISFFLNDKLKITIEEDPLPLKKQQKKEPETSQKPETGSKKRERKNSSTQPYNSSDTYSMETAHKMPCTSPGPMVKLKRLLAPEDYNISGYVTKKSPKKSTPKFDTTENKEKSLPIPTKKDCGTYCPKKRKIGQNLVNPEEIQVTHNSEDGEKKVIPEVVKEGNNFKIIIKVKKPTKPSDSPGKCSKCCSAFSITSRYEPRNSTQKNSSNVGFNILNTYFRTNEFADSRTIPVEFFNPAGSVKSSYSVKICPYAEADDEIILSNKNSPVNISRMSAVNIILSPRPLTKKNSKSEEIMKEERGYISNKDCWDKLEEFEEKTIREFRPYFNTTQTFSEQMSLYGQVKSKQSYSKKEEYMINNSLTIPSSILAVSSKERETKTQISTTVGLKDDITCIYTGKRLKTCISKLIWDYKSGFTKSSRKNEASSDQSENIQCENGFFKLELLRNSKAIKIRKNSKSDSDMYVESCNSYLKSEKTNSSCNVNGKVPEQIYRKVCDVSTNLTYQWSSSITEDQGETTPKVQEISIQTNEDLLEPLGMRICGLQMKMGGTEECLIEENEKRNTGLNSKQQTCCESTNEDIIKKTSKFAETSTEISAHSNKQVTGENMKSIDIQRKYDQISNSVEDGKSRQSFLQNSIYHFMRCL